MDIDAEIFIYMVMAPLLALLVLAPVVARRTGKGRSPQDKQLSTAAKVNLFCLAAAAVMLILGGMLFVVAAINRIPFLDLRVALWVLAPATAGVAISGSWMALLCWRPEAGMFATSPVAKPSTRPMGAHQPVESSTPIAPPARVHPPYLTT